MEDRLKFRAKRKDNGELVYGCFATLPCGIAQSGYSNEFSDFGDYIIIHKTKQSSYYSNATPMEVCYCEYYLIDFNTLQQCTGLKDKNRKLIYEGDIVRGKSWGAYHNVEVSYFRVGYLPFISVPVEVALSFDNLSDIEIIGNVYENPELLEDNQ